MSSSLIIVRFAKISGSPSRIKLRGLPNDIYNMYMPRNIIGQTPPTTLPPLFATSYAQYSARKNHTLKRTKHVGISARAGLHFRFGEIKQQQQKNNQNIQSSWSASALWFEVITHKRLVRSFILLIPNRFSRIMSFFEPFVIFYFHERSLSMVFWWFSWCMSLCGHFWWGIWRSHSSSMK